MAECWQARLTMRRFWRTDSAVGLAATTCFLWLGSLFLLWRWAVSTAGLAVKGLAGTLLHGGNGQAGHLVQPTMAGGLFLERCHSNCAKDAPLDGQARSSSGMGRPRQGHGANEQKSAQVELRRDWPSSAGQGHA